jgi:spore coat protein U-like protein
MPKSLLGVAFLCALWPIPAAAQTSIAAGCWVNGTGQSGSVGRIAVLDFGTSPASVSNTRTASTLAAQSLSMRCTPNTQLTIRLDQGRNASATSRRLRRGTSSYMMDYSLCRDVACSPPIGLTDQTTRTLSVADAADVRLTYYAQLVVPTNLPPGLYTDDIMVTMSW